MTETEELAALIAEAEPLRGLDPEVAEARGLPKLIDRINAIRFAQATRAHEEYVERVKAALVTLEEPPKRGPGRPRKAAE